MKNKQKCKQLLKVENDRVKEEEEQEDTIPKTEKRKILSTLIKDINKKESNPCIKVEYRLENGKIIKKRMKIPNCSNCSNSICPEPTLQPSEVYDKCNNKPDETSNPIPAKLTSNPKCHKPTFAPKCNLPYNLNN